MIFNGFIDIFLGPAFFETPGTLGQQLQKMVAQQRKSKQE